jgi:hypothetical protein
MAMLFVRISQSHAIDVDTVREYAQQRDIILDAVVLVVFAFAYVVGSLCPAESDLAC